MWETVWDILVDTLKDTAEIIPILFLAYLLMAVGSVVSY